MKHRPPRSARPAASPPGPKPAPAATTATGSAPPFFGPGQYAKRDANVVAAGAKDAVDRAASDRGEPLRADLRARFESSLGADLSGVRVHRGAASAEASTAVGANAYTIGNDIHFGAGRYQPTDPSGVRLLAHEVAHTVQQAGTPPQRQRQLEVSAPGDGPEVEADRAADAMIRGERAAVGRAHPHLARDKQGTPDAGPPETANAGVGEVNADGTEVVDHAGHKQTVIETLAHGEKVQVTHNAGSHYKVVTPSGKTGYVLRSNVDVQTKPDPSEQAPVAQPPAQPAAPKGGWTPPKADHYPHESMDPRVLKEKPASPAKVWNPPAPDGWKYWPLDKKILPRGKEMTNQALKKPMGTFVQDVVNGELIAARTEWHNATVKFDEHGKAFSVPGVFHAGNLMVPLVQPPDLPKK